MEKRDRYISPFSERYGSKEMHYIFSPDKKYTTWRKLWVALAESEMELGLKEITPEMIDEMKRNIDHIDYDLADQYELKFRHDVMAHIYAYGDVCPTARKIIHLGATSCYVGDNTDIIVIKEALELIKAKLVNVISLLAKFADKYKQMPTLAYTHLQPAQPTTVGKRASLWLNEFLFDYKDLEYVLGNMRLLGSKGTTGTQASFVGLFQNKETPKKLDEMIAHKMGFEGTYAVSGQTYSRKLDSRVYNILSGIAASATKMTNDIRFLQHLKEIEEPFEKNQIGSSAMPYKRNPMRSERVASLSRYVIANSLNTYMTSSSQWLERTLDDSANKRIVISEGFLAIDSVLDLLINITDGLVVNEKVIEKNLRQELPFMITEDILMGLVKEGGDRQTLHEEIRKLSIEAGERVKKEGLDNDLFERMCNSEVIKLSKEKQEEYFTPSKYTGRCAEQVKEFLENEVSPILEKNRDLLGMKVSITK